MSTNDRFALPAKTALLFEKLREQTPSPVQFRLPSWNAGPRPPRQRADPPVVPSRLTTSRPSSDFTGSMIVSLRAKRCCHVCLMPVTRPGRRRRRGGIIRFSSWRVALEASNSRSLRNTRTEPGDVDVAVTAVRESIVALRSIQYIDDPAIADNASSLRIGRRGRSRLRQRFAFAGTARDGHWQPPHTRQQGSRQPAQDTQFPAKSND